MLSQADDIPVVDIPIDPDAPTAKSVFVHHQLAANRCLVAVMQACRQSPGTHLRQWTSDPYSRVRYLPEGAKFWRSVHPDAIVMLQVDDREHWAFLEIDRGTQPLKRYAAKVRRYARFWLSKTWPSVYPVFPALRIVSLTTTRAAAIAALAEDVIDQFDQDAYGRLRDGLYVAATSEAELVADPFGDIWRPAYGRPRRQARVVRRRPIGTRRPALRRLCGRLRRFHVTAGEIRGAASLRRFEPTLTRVGSQVRTRRDRTAQDGIQERRSPGVTDSQYCRRQAELRGSVLRRYSSAHHGGGPDTASRPGR